MKKSSLRIAALTICAVLTLSACSSPKEEPKASEAPASAAPTQAAAPEPAKASEAPAAKIGEGRTLVVGVWGAEQEELVREHVIKPFEAETGAKVELILGGTADRYSKLYAEVDNPSMDVMYLNKAQTEQASRDGMILAADPVGISNYNSLYDVAKCGDGYGVALIATGLMYSTEEFSTPPESWSVVLDYKGKVAPYTFPSSQGTAFLCMLSRAMGGDDKNVDKAFEALAGLKPYPLVASGIPELNQAFLDGDIVLAPQMSGYVYSAASEGIPVDFAVPKEGAVLSMNCAVIPKNTKNADLSKIFINYHLAQACQEGYAKRLFYGPTNSKVVLDKELADKVVYGNEDVAKLVALDNEWLQSQEAAWTEKWNNMILD